MMIARIATGEGVGGGVYLYSIPSHRYHYGHPSMTVMGVERGILGICPDLTALNS